VDTYITDLRAKVVREIAKGERAETVVGAISDEGEG
jgi:hypothetical protein